MTPHGGCRRLALVALVAASAGWGQTNSIIIREKSGASQTNVPVQIGRPFLDTEILNYPQAVCGGVPLVTQADVKKRHGSGYVQFAVIAFLLPNLGASASVTCTFQNQAGGNNTSLTKTQMLDAAYNFEATMELTAPNCPGCANGGTATTGARAALNAWDGASDGYTGPVWKWTSGTVAQTVVIADHAGKSGDLGWKQSGATPLKASLSISSGVAAYSQISAENATGWTFPQVVRVNSVNNTDETSVANAEDIRVCSADTGVTPHLLFVCGISNVTVSGTTVTVTTAQPHGIRSGQRVTIAEVKQTGNTLWGGVNGYWLVTVTGSSAFTYTSVNVVAGTYLSGGIYGRAYNDTTLMGCAAYIAADANGNPAGCYVFPNLWSDAPTNDYRSFRPIVHATFWPVINKVRVRFIGEIADSERFADQIYHLVLKTGSTSPAVRYNTVTDRGDSIFHRAGSRWTKEFWIGGTPAAIAIDHNLEYLKATRWVFNYDTDVARNATLAVTESHLASHYALWSGRLHDLYDFANLEKSQGSPSGDDQDGAIPVWALLWLRTMDNRMKESTVGHAELGASWYIHMREGTTGKKLTRPASAGCPWACDADGAGRILSVTSRKQFFSRNIKSRTQTPTAERINVPGGVEGSASTTGGFRLGVIHLFEPFSTPYTLLGDFFFLEEMWFWSGYTSAYTYAAMDNVGYARGPLNLGYGVSGTPAAICINAESTLKNAVDASTQVIELANTTLTWPATIAYVNMIQPNKTTGQAVNVKSTNAADAQDVLVVGKRLGQTTYSTETVRLAGTTTVTTAITNWVLISGFKIYQPGTTTPTTPAGTVSLSLASGTIGVIPQSDFQSSFLNHPLNDGIRVFSSDTRDTFDVRITGIRNGQSAPTSETIRLAGTSPVTTAITDWYTLLAVEVFRQGTTTISYAFGDVKLQRTSDSLTFFYVRFNHVFPYIARLDAGANVEAVRVLGLDIAARTAYVVRGVAGTSATSHAAAARAVYEVSDTNNWEMRSTAWILRFLAISAYATPDNFAEGSYITSVIRDQFATMEGQRNLPKSLTDASYTAMWNFGNTTQREVGGPGNTKCNGEEMFGTLGIYDRGGPAFNQGWPVVDQALIYGMDKSVTYDATNGFGEGYMAMGIGRAEELGYPATTMMNEMAKFYNGLVNSVTTEACANCPYTVLTSGRHGATKRVDNKWVASFTGLRSLYDDGTYSGINWQGRTSFPTTSLYPCVGGMATAFTAGKAGGATAESWLSTNLRSKVIWQIGPQADAGNTCNLRNSIVPRPSGPGPLTILTSTLPNGTVGSAYSYTLAASGGVLPYTWSILSGALPAGLTLTASSGLISGTPTAAGTSSLTFNVTDSVPSSASRTLALTISPPPGLVQARFDAVSSKAVVGYGHAGLAAATTCVVTVALQSNGQNVFSSTDSGGIAWRQVVATGLSIATAPRST